MHYNKTRKQTLYQTRSGQFRSAQARLADLLGRREALRLAGLLHGGDEPLLCGGVGRAAPLQHPVSPKRVRMHQPQTDRRGGQSSKPHAQTKEVRRNGHTNNERTVFKTRKATPKAHRCAGLMGTLLKAESTSALSKPGTTPTIATNALKEETNSAVTLVRGPQRG